MKLNFRGGVRDATYRLLHQVRGARRGVRAILMYHSVGSEAASSLPEVFFRRQMEYLQANFRIVPLKDFLATAEKLPAEENLVALTFDDGYLDNYQIAFPILERYGIRGTFFVTTGFVGGKFPSTHHTFPMMTAAQLREMAAAGQEIGAHTVSHPKLTRIAPTEARREILQSKRELEDMLGETSLSFAYPKGACNEAVRKEVENAGFRYAVTVEEGLVKPRSQALLLPRIWVSENLDGKLFQAKVSRASEWYAQLRGLPSSLMPW